MTNAWIYTHPIACSHATPRVRGRLDGEMESTLPEALNGARILESAESRDGEAPLVVLCENSSMSPPFYVVSLLTRAGSSIEAVYHASYSTALEDFLGRSANEPTK